MKDKVYHLCVELIIDDKKQIVTLAEGDLLALEKYTAFCGGPIELLRTMPDKESFSSKNFLDRYLLNVNDNNDPFIIRTSNAKRPKKIPLLYKKDEDVLLSNKEEIVQNIRDNYKFTIEDVVAGEIDEKTKSFFKELWDLFYDQKFADDFYEYVDAKLNPDKIVSFDKRYEIVINNKWMILGISRTVLEKFIKLIFKDPKKRIELLKYLKENYKNIIPVIDFSERQKRLNLLEKELEKKRINSSKIRRQINKNLYEFSLSLVSPAPIIKDTPPVYNITEEEIIELNNKRTDLSPIQLRILELSEELLKLKNELESLRKQLFFSISESTRKLIEQRVIEIEQKISQLEYDISELENNNYFYSDSGELIKEDEMIK